MLINTKFDIGKKYKLKFIKHKKSRIKCNYCNGIGEVEILHNSIPYTIDCFSCGGTGHKSKLETQEEIIKTYVIVKIITTHKDLFYDLYLIDKSDEYSEIELFLSEKELCEKVIKK